ncbi:MAG: fructose-bisphosphatase class III [Clostridia bacterium]|nr:fructose-bisphosphatase class III [Clostridia bacterium]
MVYAMSDLHGCYEKFAKMLKKINFKDSDTLYILGDIVDRGDGGIKILQDIMTRPNVIVIQGNHDFSARRLLKMLCMPENEAEYEKAREHYAFWSIDGGQPTYRSFVALSFEEQKKILSYMNSFLIYDEIIVNNNTFFMSHTVPEKNRMLNFENLLWQEFIAGEPEYDKQYFDNKYIITGHTPTAFIDPDCKGKIYKKNNHIAIDCGAVFGNPLGCIRLDTLEEFYVEGN